MAVILGINSETERVLGGVTGKGGVIQVVSVYWSTVDNWDVILFADV